MPCGTGPRITRADERVRLPVRDWLHLTINLMATKKRHGKTPPAGETGQEALYLKSLSERQVPVVIKLRDGEQVNGWIEYFDDMMLRLTREGKPNLIIYKSQIRTISESTQPGARRAAAVARE